ncbi:uncharacterized protein ntf4 [Gouania willdenowi]|uniref:Neurotrophin-4 n=1 Tax=Gouania willdenowi TaxID=441366 RepID=A0A8C5DKD5_GOUWI|nr:uncharacterized protein LOC114468329 [Gouania willdenowi]
MHWLPLVAMVIASALPFPYKPASRIAAATTEFDSANRREQQQRHDPAGHPTAPPPDRSADGNTSLVDRSVDAALIGQNNQLLRISTKGDESTFKGRSPLTSRSKRVSGGEERGIVGLDVPSEGAALRNKGFSEDNSLPKDFVAHGNKPDFSSFTYFSNADTFQDSPYRHLQDSPENNHDTVSPAGTLSGQRGAGPTAPSEQTLDSEILEGDELFLDAHPRVLFSPSPSPPDQPPLLLMLETGLLEDNDRDKENQEDMDGHVEGHGDRAIDRSTTPTWASVANEAVRHVRRDKRSHLMDRRRGEKSVCEAESLWVTDKKVAIDSHGRKVTILQEIQTQTGPLKQYFYETRCRQAEQQSRPSTTGKSPGTGVAGAGCLGVDKRHWMSECTVKQSFVRALTKDANNRIGWRWIRIDSSCVCVLLSRTNQAVRKETVAGKSKG